LIETEKQRRWWFATHPEFSHKGTGPRGNEEEDEDNEKVRPQDVDAYVDDQLPYASGIQAELLKEIRFWFGTEFSSKTPAQQHALLWGDDEYALTHNVPGDESVKELPLQESTGHPAADRNTYDKYEDVLDRITRNAAEDPAKDAFIKEMMDAGWTRESAESRWEVFKLNESIAKRVGRAMTVYGAIAGARAIMSGAYRWVTSAGRSATANGSTAASNKIEAGTSEGKAAAASGEAPVCATISRTKHPEAAEHVEAAQAAGQPAELTIDRVGAKARGREALRGYPSKPGKDRDEYPPKMFEEGGRGASVRPIAPSDNRGAGASVGNQLRKHLNGTKVKIEVVD